MSMDFGLLTLKTWSSPMTNFLVNVWPHITLSYQFLVKSHAWSSSMSMDFGLLTLKTWSSPLTNFLVNVWAHITLSYRFLRLPNTGVSKRMQRVKYISSELMWHIWTWYSSRHITENVGVSARNWNSIQYLSLNWASSGSVCCSVEMSLKSTAGVCVVCIALVSTHDKASATLLSEPLMWQMSLVNWEIYSNCLSCHGLWLWLVCRANVKGLWSVRM